MYYYYQLVDYIVDLRLKIRKTPEFFKYVLLKAVVTSKRVFDNHEVIIPYVFNKTLKFWKINKQTTNNLAKKKFIKNESLILFLRKNKIFNKSKYSRNRQNYRTGVYFCIWINVILVVGLVFFFYRFTFSFGYLWWVSFLLLCPFTFNKAIKYNFYNPKIFLSNFKNILIWFFFLIKPVLIFLNNCYITILDFFEE